MKLLNINKTIKLLVESIRLMSNEFFDPFFRSIKFGECYNYSNISYFFGELSEYNKLIKLYN